MNQVNESIQDLKGKSIRGGSARVAALGANFALRLGSMMVLSRLLDPADFGLIGMVTAFTGILFLFRDFGLSSATIQRATVTNEQTSTLFWINVLIGTALTLVTVALAHVVSSFYQEPRLASVTIAVAVGFFFSGVSAQHSALLQREMRFTALAVIETASWVVGTTIAIGAAKAGYGYWSLVVMTVSLPIFSAIGLWVTAGWIPGRPCRGCGLRSMLRFGGTLTLNGVLLYLGSNVDKVLLGRFWGVEAIGLYGRAYQLSRVPIESLNWVVGEVAFSALSRLQDDPGRLRRYFLKGYSLVLALTLPITAVCALFPLDVVVVLLGPKWKEAAPMFRLLAPTILVFAISNPLGWLLNSLGLAERNLKISAAFAPLVISGYALGLPHGPKGVALAYSVVMVLWTVPAIAWSVHGTMISCWDIVAAASRPIASVAIAGSVAFGVHLLWGPMLSPLPRLVLETLILGISYLSTLLFVAGEREFYLDLLRGLRSRSVTGKTGIPVDA